MIHEDISNMLLVIPIAVVVLSNYMEEHTKI